MEHTTHAQGLVQEIASQVQEAAHRQITSVVSRCLQAVFGKEAYQFRIRFAKKRGKTEAELLLERDGLVLEDPLNQGGGGQCEVAAFALRLACLLLEKPPRRKTLFLDQPFSHVNGEDYQERVGEMMVALAQDLGVQFVIASDKSWLKVGKVIHL